ncbi:MAG TPA: hypothetical protein VHY30_07805 [Verrucomicrobiae bacterium]|nr:hypothetical protein [Verrucomicrobiae bacterium]
MKKLKVAFGNRGRLFYSAIIFSRNVTAAVSSIRDSGLRISELMVLPSNWMMPLEFLPAHASMPPRRQRTFCKRHLTHRRQPEKVADFSANLPPPLQADFSATSK